MKFYLMSFENWKIPVYIQDNKMNSTLFAIHGINSSSDFVSGLTEFSNNFNVVAINLPGSKYFSFANKTNEKDISMENWIKISNFVSKKLKTKNNYLLAHSMGGGVSVRIASSPIFKKCYNLSTINPTLKNSRLIKVYKHYRDPKNFFQQTLSKGMKISMNYYQKNNDWIKPFAADDSVWIRIIDENVINPKKLDDLDYYYKNTSRKSVMMIGSLDLIIGTNEFYQYAKSINVPCYIIGKGHNPVSRNPRDFYVFFKKEIIGKKRFFWEKLIKLPKDFFEKNDVH